MDSLVQAQLCLTHDRPIEYYCKDDEKQICSRCYIMGDHKDHTIIAFEEKNKSAISSIESGIEMATIVYNKLSKLDKVTVSKKLKQEKLSMIENINQTYSKLYVALKQREKAIYAEVNRIYDLHIAQAECQVQNAKNAKQNLESSLMTAQSLLQNKNLIVDGEEIYKALTDAQFIPCMVSKNSSSLEWDKTHIEDIIEAITSFGSVKNEEKKLRFLNTIKEQPEDITSSDRIFSFPLVSQKSYDARSISSVDTGEDVIIESDTDSVVSSTTTNASSLKSTNKSSKSKNKNYSSARELIFPQINGTLKQVTVTHIRSPNDFFVQMDINKAKLELLSRNLNSWCRKKSTDKQVPTFVEKGMKVLACYSDDNQWYRALVLNVDMEDGNGDKETKIHVMYYDFGNDEKLSLKSLRVMEARFSHYPAFCIQCSLSDVAPYNTKEWDLGTVQEFFKMTQYQSLLLNVLALKSNMYEVDLLCMPTEDVLDDKVASVRDMLVFLGLAKFAGPSNSLAGATKPGFRIKTVQYFKPTALPSGETVEVIVAEAASPSDLYIVAMGDEFDYYLNMMREMEEVYSNDTQGIYNMHCPRCGDLCVVKHSDDKWYRGEIVSEPKVNKVSVYLPDTGSTINVHKNQLRKLLSNFIKLAAQAVHCRLADVGFVEDDTVTEWSNDAKQWCGGDLKNSQGMARIVRWGVHADIVLWIDANRPSVNALLVEAGLATSTGLASTPSFSQGKITVSSTYNTDNRHQKKNKPTTATTSSPSRDKKATTKSVSSPTVSSSKPVDEQTTSTTAATSSKSKRSKVDKKSSRHGQNKSSTKLARDGENDNEEFSVSVATVTTGGGVDYAKAEEIAKKRKVQDDIHKALDTSPEDRETAQRNGDSTYVSIVVSYYKSPREFYIRIEEKEAALGEFLDELNEEYQDSEPDMNHEWNVDDCCVVRCRADGCWYRGKIVSTVSATDVQVELLDCGNVFRAPRDDLRPLVRDLGTRLHTAAVKCCLADLIPTGTTDTTKWSQTATEYVSRIIKTNKLYIKMEGEPTSELLPIDLIVEVEIPETAFDPVTFTYYSLRQKMVEDGLAYFDRTKQQQKKEKKDFEEESKSKAKDIKTPELPIVTEVPPYTLPELNSTINILPTFIDYDGVIYAQQIDWNDDVIHLSNELQRVYKDSDPCEREWRAGDNCVAYFKTDGLWYRGLIEEMDGLIAKVFYMDYGNSAWVKQCELRELRAPFGDYHVQVYHCVLEDVIPNTATGRWPEAVLDIMHEMVVNCLCTMCFSGTKDNGHMKITLQRSDGVDLSSYLVDNEFGLSTMDMRERFEHSRLIGSVWSACELCKPVDVAGVGCVMNAEATELELPNIVYVQRTKMEDCHGVDFVQSSEIACVNSLIDEYAQMMEDIRDTPSSGFIKLPDVGTLCLGKFHYDHCWYRALCVEKYPETDSCLVVFIDFGTPDVVARDGLRSLPTQFWSMPSQAIRCYLNLKPPGMEGAQWKRNSHNAMAKALGQKALKVKVVQSEPLTVELFEETEHGLCLAYEEVVQTRLAVLPTEVDITALLGEKADRDILLGEVEIEEVVENKNEEFVGHGDINDNVDENNKTDALIDVNNCSSNNSNNDNNVREEGRGNEEGAEIIKVEVDCSGSIVKLDGQVLKELKEKVDAAVSEAWNGSGDSDEDEEEEGWSTDSEGGEGES